MPKNGRVQGGQNPKPVNTRRSIHRHELAYFNLEDWVCQETQPYVFQSDISAARERRARGLNRRLRALETRDKNRLSIMLHLDRNGVRFKTQSCPRVGLKFTSRLMLKVSIGRTDRRTSIQPLQHSHVKQDASVRLTVDQEYANSVESRSSLQVQSLKKNFPKRKGTSDKLANISNVTEHETLLLIPREAARVAHLQSAGRCRDTLTHPEHVLLTRAVGTSIY